MLNIHNETDTLTDLCVCRGVAVPPCDGFQNDHPEFEVFTMLPWDREKLLRQQQAFYDVMAAHHVRLHFVPSADTHPWAMYTRDTGFVIADTLYFSRSRELPEREGEIDKVLGILPDISTKELAGRIEGGDVMPDGDVVYVGLGTRTSAHAAAELGQHAEVIPLHLGPKFMHLDTRMTILPGRRLLICPEPFRPQDLGHLKDRFTLIEVSEAEAMAMATNVFVLDPETVILHAGFPRIADKIEDAGLRAIRLDWSEPNALLGSFRCATMPLARTA